MAGRQSLPSGLSASIDCETMPRRGRRPGEPLLGVGVAKKKAFDKENKRILLQYGRDLITEFEKGLVVKDNPHAQDWGASGWTLFDGYTVRFTEDFLRAQREFTRCAAKMLEARSAHEKTIRDLCQIAAQDHVRGKAAADQEIPGALEAAARGLVDKVLAEAGREYTHIEPNFLIRHSGQDVLALGRVRSMPTEMAAAKTSLSKNPKIRLAVAITPTCHLRMV